jgi:hypothetical protein
VDHLKSKGTGYSDIKDFRDKKEMCSRIVEHDLEYIKKADILEVSANGPSYGKAIELFVAKNSSKKVILLVRDPVSRLWPLNI